MNKITVLVTVGGQGTRMKCISPMPKHLLYYGGKRIIGQIVECFSGIDDVRIFDGYHEGGRKYALEPLRGMKNVLVCDCDIIPVGWKPRQILTGEDWIWCFKSNNPKYGGIYNDKNGSIESVVEKGDSTAFWRSSGLYFLSDVGATLDRMTDPNSIAGGMIGAKILPETTFIRLGDPEDYLSAVLAR